MGKRSVMHTAVYTFATEYIFQILFMIFPNCCNLLRYQKAAKAYKDPTMLETVDMAGRVCMVTGANSGIGKEIAE